MTTITAPNGTNLSFDFDEDCIHLITVDESGGVAQIPLDPTNVGILMGVLATWTEYTQR